MQPTTVTGHINAKAFELLEQYPEGLRWSEMRRGIEASDHNFHPKTVNGCIWKLVQNFPDKIYKPSKGVFRLLKYESAEVEKEHSKNKSKNERSQKSDKINLQS